MAPSDTQSTDAPASKAGTATDRTQNDNKVYVNLSFNYDAKAVKTASLPGQHDSLRYPVSKW
jgi:hypothetical protein